MNLVLGRRDGSGKVYLNEFGAKLCDWQNQRQSLLHAVSIRVLSQGATHNSPRTGSAAFLPMDIERIVVGLPLAEMLAAYEAANIVLILCTWVVVKACLCECFWSRLHPVLAVGPFKLLLEAFDTLGLAEG